MDPTAPQLKPVIKEMHHQLTADQAGRYAVDDTLQRDGTGTTDSHTVLGVVDAAHPATPWQCDGGKI
jgi:hypothetical protein